MIKNFQKSLGNFMELRYWRSEMIFGNGLVINKFNTQGTEYDHSQSFDSFVTRLVAEKIQEYEGPTRNINDQGGMDEENHNNNLDGKIGKLKDVL